jgi:dihydrofolate reductase
VIALVVAQASNRVIGRNGELPWHLPGDMRHFRELTTGKAVLMGRKTYESIPARFRPLPERRNLVLTRNGFEAHGAETFGSLDAALKAADECFVIGGDAVYAQALPLADRLYVTDVEASSPGDAFFPPIDAVEWRCTHEGEPLEENGLRYRFKTYDRR